MNLFLDMVLYVVYSLPIFIIARKSEHEYAWFAFIPFLDLWLMCDMADVEIWWILIFMLPFINVLFYIYLWSRIAENTNKSPLWGILMIVPVVDIAVGFYLALYEGPNIRT